MNDTKESLVGVDFAWMINNSNDAKKCLQSFLDQDFLSFSLYLVEMVKTGYSREEIKLFLEEVCSKKNKIIFFKKKIKGAKSARFKQNKK
jgi:hypothetical protein